MSLPPFGHRDWIWEKNQPYSESGGERSSWPGGGCRLLFNKRGPEKVSTGGRDVLSIDLSLRGVRGSPGKKEEERALVEGSTPSEDKISRAQKEVFWERKHLSHEQKPRTSLELGTGEAGTRELSGKVSIEAWDKGTNW